MKKTETTTKTPTEVALENVTRSLDDMRDKYHEKDRDLRASRGRIDELTNELSALKANQDNLSQSADKETRSISVARKGDEVFVKIGTEFARMNPVQAIDFATGIIRCARDAVHEKVQSSIVAGVGFYQGYTGQEIKSP